MNQPAPDWPHAAAPGQPVAPEMPAPMGAPPAPGHAPMPAPAAPLEVQLPAAPAAALDAGVALQHDVQPAGGQPAVTQPAVTQPMTQQPAVDADAGPASAPTSPESVAWTPGIGLLLAVTAITWQFVSFYAREQLPVLESSGAALNRYDQIVGAMPLAGSSLGAFIGIAIAAAALVVVLIGARQGLRATGLQALVGALALVGILLALALPSIAG